MASGAEQKTVRSREREHLHLQPFGGWEGGQHSSQTGPGTRDHDNWSEGPVKSGVLLGAPLFLEVAPPTLSPGSCGGSRLGLRSPEAWASPQLGQQKQERALALLRQQAELEVWETQKALDQLLRKHRLEVNLAAPRSLLRAARPACPSEPAAPQGRCSSLTEGLPTSADAVGGLPTRHAAF